MPLTAEKLVQSELETRHIFVGFSSKEEREKEAAAAAADTVIISSK